MEKYKNKNKVLKSFRGYKIQVSHDEVLMFMFKYTFKLCLKYIYIYIYIYQCCQMINRIEKYTFLFA